MALGKNRRRINVKAGGTLLLRELSPTPTDAFSDAGYIESLVVNDEATMIDIPDAEGNMIEYLSGQRRVGLEITLSQSSKDEIDVIKDADGKYYDLFYAVPLVNLSETQQWSFCLVKFKPGPNLNFAGATKRTIKLEAVAVVPKAAFTRTPATFNIVANQPYITYQNATPAATPTDVAADMATAII